MVAARRSLHGAVAPDGSPHPEDPPHAPHESHDEFRRHSFDPRLSYGGEETAAGLILATVLRDQRTPSATMMSLSHRSVTLASAHRPSRETVNPPRPAIRENRNGRTPKRRTT